MIVARQCATFNNTLDHVMIKKKLPQRSWTFFNPHLMDERFSAMEADVVGRVRLRLLLWWGRWWWWRFQWWCWRLQWWWLRHIRWLVGMLKAWRWKPVEDVVDAVGIHRVGCGGACCGKVLWKGGKWRRNRNFILIRGVLQRTGTAMIFVTRGGGGYVPVCS